MKTANLAIVFTDIKGFTERTSRQTHEENQRLLKVHHDLLAPLFNAFGGKILKSIGDAFLVTFESPTQAVLSGIAIQDRLWQYNRTVPRASSSTCAWRSTRERCASRPTMSSVSP